MHIKMKIKINESSKSHDDLKTWKLVKEEEREGIIQKIESRLPSI